jgi:uncharacterized protein YbaP (TraB family)
MKYILSLLLCGKITAGNAQLLYRCESPSADTVTYVFGSMHEIPREIFRHDPVFNTIISQTDIYFSEQLIWDTTAMFQKIAAVPKSTSYYPQGKTLKDSVTTGQLKQLQAFYKKTFNIPAGKFNEELGRSPYMIHLAFSRNTSRFAYPDRILLDKAVAKKKTVVQVDLTDTFVNTLKFLQRYWTVDSLVSLPARYNEVLRYDSTLLALYSKQDTAGMKRVMEATYRNVPAYQYSVITSRNTEWEKTIMAHGKKINFVVCGISHVISDGGLLDFFRKKNYRIDAMQVRLTK